MVPASFVTNLSASTKVVELADVSPSIIFNSVAVEVTPSKMLSSAVVDVTPSKIFNSAVVAVTPSNKFNSVAVEVTATSSFTFGDVKVLFVNVAVEAVDTKSTLPPVLGSVKTLEALCA